MKPEEKLALLKSIKEKYTLTIPEYKGIQEMIAEEEATINKSTNVKMGYGMIQKSVDRFIKEQLKDVAPTMDGIVFENDKKYICNGHMAVEIPVSFSGKEASRSAHLGMEKYFGVDLNGFADFQIGITAPELKTMKKKAIAEAKLHRYWYKDSRLVYHLKDEDGDIIASYNVDYLIHALEMAQTDVIKVDPSKASVSAAYFVGEHCKALVLPIKCYGNNIKMTIEDRFAII